MDIFEEYKLQQTWRNWHQYIDAIPLKKNDRVIDLGCSVGGVANILSSQVTCVTGIDLNSDFVNYCQANRQANQDFICSDFTKINYNSLLPITGVWASFSISYIENPQAFLKTLFGFLQPGGWIALVDVSCFLSGNMLPDSKYFNLVRAFEVESYQSGSYDFDMGSKLEPLLKRTGFDIIYADRDVTDAELNFKGVASPQILLNWKARLARMHSLKNKYPNQYAEICQEIIAGLEAAQHRKNNNVQFFVARKV